ncbi:MAG: aconitase X catalytic domain-containing protein [Desulfurococcaceae archaeon]
MYLTREQEKMLRGDYGWSTAKAMEILVKVGEAMGASELIEIKHAHISGVSYVNIGKYGVLLIYELLRGNAKAKVFTTINPGCIDYSSLSSIIDNSLEKEQSIIDQLFMEMGFKPIFTCIPYHYRPPLPFEHLAWGESSAVIFSNTVFGGFTNREGGPIAIASALTGYVYKAGLHILENRIAKVNVELGILTSRTPVGAIGLWIGENIGDLPLLTQRGGGLDIYRLKVLLAAMAASGSHAMAVIPGVTPKGTYMVEIEDKVVIEPQYIEKYIGEIPDSSNKILGYIGCPHLHPVELYRIYSLLKKYGPPRSGNKLMITIPPEYVDKHRNIIYALKALGTDIATGTCPVVAKIRREFDIVVTNSGKAAFYLSKIHGLRTSIMELEEVVKTVGGKNV